LGVDLSTLMVDWARRRADADGLHNVSFLAADAQVYPFPEAGYDVMISRFGASFFADPVAAFTNLRRALRPNGRVVVLTWRPFADNEWLVAIREALAAGRQLPDPSVGHPGPFGLADRAGAAAVFAAAGFADVDFVDVQAPVQLGVDVGAAQRFLADLGLVRGLLHELSPEASSQAWARLTVSLAAHHRDDHVWYESAAWLITARRDGLDASAP
jgi:SAM-dependent methyltransferase